MTSHEPARVVVSEAASVSGDFDETRRRSRAGSETQELESSAGSELASALVRVALAIVLNSVVFRIARSHGTWIGTVARSISTSWRCELKQQKKKKKKKKTHTTKHQVRAALEAGKERDTLAAVLQYKGEREKEIRDVCDVHYQDFVRSVDELLELRHDTMNLHDGVAELNADLQQSGAVLVDVSQELIRAKRTLRNVRRLAVLVSAGQHAAEIAARVEHDTAEGRFYQALRGVAALERALDTPESALRQLEFGRYVAGVLPVFRARAREKSMQALNEWLEVVRRRALDVGKLALDRTARRAERERQHGPSVIDVTAATAPSEAVAAVTSSASTRGGPLAKRASKSRRGAAPAAAEDEASRIASRVVEEPLMAELKLDFRPLFQCAAVYSALGIGSQFATYYTENRRKQADLIDPADADTFSTSTGRIFSRWPASSSSRRRRSRRSAAWWCRRT
jgi:hypothetical protein